MPKLTIVTIVKDHSEGLLKTLRSVAFQTYKDYEYIVVDGASEDGTLEVIKEHSQLFSKILYGPDKGIYDAMNKGLDSAEGEYIIFMNAGDVFASESSLEDVFSSVNGNYDVIYGDYTVNYGYTRKYIVGLKCGEIWKGMLTSHQATLVRTEIAKKYRFDLGYRLGADFDMIYRIYRDGGLFGYVPVEIAETESGGLSDTKRLTVYKNHLDTLKTGGISVYQRIYYMYLFTDAWLRLMLKRILPVKLVKKIIAMKADR